MKAHYKTKDGRLTFEVAAETVKDLFEGVAQVQEIFECESICGCCGSQSVRFRVRNADGNKFYEKHCDECNAQFSFGQHKTGGTLFPKLRADGVDLPNGGWKKWQREQDSKFTP